MLLGGRVDRFIPQTTFNYSLRVTFAIQYTVLSYSKWMSLIGTDTPKPYQKELIDGDCRNAPIFCHVFRRY